MFDVFRRLEGPDEPGTQQPPIVKHVGIPRDPRNGHTLLEPASEDHYCPQKRIFLHGPLCFSYCTLTNSPSKPAMPHSQTLFPHTHLYLGDIRGITGPYRGISSQLSTGNFTFPPKYTTLYNPPTPTATPDLPPTNPIVSSQHFTSPVHPLCTPSNMPILDF